MHNIGLYPSKYLFPIKPINGELAIDRSNNNLYVYASEEWIKILDTYYPYEENDRSYYDDELDDSEYELN
jgi:hypothetical protein